ncbi:hypothetical protein RFF05_08390 [Bengtsoniella intestinalis]|uniref:hypothetical protein n=1 Tax=Bengtsoniella intestinalis TaxID=3073143 RepID=UPI00391F68D6
MLLSIQQKEIEDWVWHLKYVRKQQLYEIISRSNPVPIHIFNAMVSQLVRIHLEIRCQGDIIMWDKREINPDFLAAIDIMISVAGENPIRMKKEKCTDALLRFYVEIEEKYRPFSVAYYDETVASFMDVKYTERVIFLMPDNQIPTQSNLPFRHFFAVKQDDGAYQFFSPSDE